LVSLEQAHAESRDAIGRAHARVDDHEERVRIIELEMPTMKLTRQWVISGVVGIWAVAALVAGRFIMQAMGIP
jgi:hypothetical protein